MENKQKDLLFCILEENNKSSCGIRKILSSVQGTFCCTFALVNKTERQQEATRFSFDYLNYLLQQEGVIERMVDMKFKDLEHKLDKMVEQKINQQLKHYK